MRLVILVGLLVADLVGWLNSADAAQSDSMCSTVAFRDYRTASQPDAWAAFAEKFEHALEQLALLHPDLVGRAADLQSRIDERLRDPVHDHDPDFDLLFR